MNIWVCLPRRVRTFFLDQPLPDRWLAAIRASLDAPEERIRGLEKLILNWQPSHGMTLALVLLVVSALALGYIME